MLPEDLGLVPGTLMGVSVNSSSRRFDSLFQAPQALQTLDVHTHIHVGKTLIQTK